MRGLLWRRHVIVLRTLGFRVYADKLRVRLLLNKLGLFQLSSQLQVLGEGPVALDPRFFPT